MSSVLSVLQRLASAIAEDHRQLRRYTSRYHAQEVPASRLPADLVQRIGLQMLAATRVMQALDQAAVPLLPQVVSRLIRHAYGAEIHWKAQIDPGVAIVHGSGLVVSHMAKVGRGCILFQNVTLGESVDPESRIVGAPTVGEDVHIGPGATLLGPISVGDRSKIMAGAVLTHSVPPDSLVRPMASIIATRREAAAAPTTGNGSTALPAERGGGES